MPAIPLSSLNIVADIAGYVARYVALAALQDIASAGPCPSLTNAGDLETAFTKQGVDVSRLDIVTVDGLLSEAELEAAFKNADGIASIARAGGADLSNFSLQVTGQHQLLSCSTACSCENLICERVVFTSKSVSARDASDSKDEPLTNKD